MPALFHFDPSQSLYDQAHHSSQFQMLENPENGGPNSEGQSDQGQNDPQNLGGDPQQSGDESAVAVSTVVETSNPAYPPLQDHSMDSIHSLLAASQQLAQTAHIDWSNEAAAENAKRKRGNSPADDSNPAKVRKTQPSPLGANVHFPNGSHPILQPAPLPHMTTVTCLHAAVAQKSYGNEKRFLCPPPVVRVDTPLTRIGHFRSQQLAMRIYPEVAEVPGPPPEQKAQLDDTMQAAFKYLHVGGTAKSKSFHLSLDLSEPPVFDGVPSATPAEGLTARMVKQAATWASFNSAPVTIISKPSKKTAKTRNLASCILAGGPVSLFNRINSQTVRTKYMTVDQGRLCASNSTWSAFNVEVVQAVTDPNAALPDLGGYHPGGAAPQPVTYGSTLLLTDSHTGLTSDPLVIRKVDKGRVIMDEGTMGGPVSQMQKVALCRITETGARYYLSAAGPLQILPDPSGASTNEGKQGVIATHPLVYQPPAVREEIKNDIRMEIDEVDDFLCWTIVGISKFQYTFFDGIHNNAFPRFPITPFPTLLSPPVYKTQTHVLELTIANFFYSDPSGATADANGYAQMPPAQPLEIWLGTLGPLNARVYQSGNLTHTIGGVAMGHGGGSSGSTGNVITHQAAVSINPAGAAASPGLPALGSLGTTIIVVEMPPIRDVLRMVEIVSGADLGLGLGGGAAQATLNQMTSMVEEAERAEGENGAGAEGEESSANDKGKEKEGDAGASAAAAQQQQQQQQHHHQLMPGPQAAQYAHYPPHIAMPVQMPAITRGVPILFVRTADGVGYHSGREIACEHVLGAIGMSQPGVPGANSPDNWTLRVL